MLPGVGQEYSFDVIISTGLGERGKEITRWVCMIFDRPVNQADGFKKLMQRSQNLPSPNQLRQHIKERNDGSMPREPYQRCSQAIFEAWLKTKIEDHPLIESHWNTKLSDFEEESKGVVASLENTKTGSSRVVKAQYLIGCDGGGSRVRRKLGLGLTGGPLSVSCLVTVPQMDQY
jgi:FAD-dependent monooxygenase